MKFFHKADMKLPKWLDDLVSGKIEKKASAINDVFVPYGLTERASQIESGLLDKLASEILENESHVAATQKFKKGDKVTVSERPSPSGSHKNQGFDGKITNVKKIKNWIYYDIESDFGAFYSDVSPQYISLREEKQIEEETEELDFIKESEEPIEEKQDQSDIEKRIEEAKTPEELEAIEKELSGTGTEEAKPTGEAGESKPVGETKPVGEVENEGEAQTNEQKEPEQKETGAIDFDQLKDDVEDLKSKMEEVSKQDTLEQQIKQLKKRLDNIASQDDPNMNDSIYQAASAIKHAERLMKRGKLEETRKIYAHLTIDVKPEDFVKEKNSFTFTMSDKNLKGAPQMLTLYNPKTKNSIDFKMFKKDTNEGDVDGYWYKSLDGKYKLLMIND